jgi:hypothetical protein
MWGLSALRDKAENSDRDLYSRLIRLHILHHVVEPDLPYVLGVARARPESEPIQCVGDLEIRA